MKPIADVKSRPARSSRGDAPVRGSRRSYSSPLRDEQAEETRIRILEALVRTMARGVADLTIPAVAEEAGVSVPTVYRHFGTKRELLDALGPYVIEKTHLMPESPLPDLGELRDLARDVYRRHSEMDLTLRAAMASELGGVIRREHMPERLAMMRPAVVAAAPELDEPTVDRLSMILVLLLSSAVMRAMRDYFELTGDDAADHVGWAAEILIRGARSDPQEE
jgi:AcrR family transcriptional regulator